jgi:hypothetical protein
LIRFLKSYWFWFYVIVTIISVVDFIDHISRTDSHFRDIWFKWLLFTIASTMTVCLTIHFTNTLTKKLFGIDNLIFQSISIIIGLLIHIYLSGPIFDWLIFGRVTLNFFPTLTIFVAGLSIFYFIRLLVHLVTRNFKSVGQDVSNG